MKYTARKTLGAGLFLLATACAGDGSDYDATGTFQATEVTVYAEQGGVLTVFGPEEGDSLASGQEFALTDTTQIWLKIRQTGAAKDVYASQKPDLQKQVGVTRQQLQTALQEQQRYRELVADGAAPRKTLDDATHQVQVLQKQLDAQTSALLTQHATLNSQMAAADVQQAQLEDQLRRCHIAAPISGTVIEKYVARGEYVAAGKPLLKMADVDRMYLRAYVTSARLQHLKVGQPATVFADYGNGSRKAYEGKVTWISSHAEFTPKTILTDDERADLVYAVKVAVKNDGYIKIGMYGEVKF